MMQMLFVFAVCLVASTIGGICGIGGGVVIKPLLDATGVMPPSTLSFLSGLTVLTMAVVNVWKNRHGKELNAQKSLPLGIGAAIGGVLGKQVYQLLLQAVAERPVLLVQSVVLGVLVLCTLLYVSNRGRISTKCLTAAPACVAVGAALGLLSAFLGIGGGPMNLAVLYYFFSMNTKQAAVNSIVIILLSQLASLGMTVATGAVPAFDWGTLAAMAFAGVLGGLISAKMQKKLTNAQTDKLFCGLLVVILLICVYNAIRAVA